MNETLKQIRINALNFSDNEMAQKLNISLSSYKELENKPLEMKTLMYVAQSVGKPIDFLLNMQKDDVNFEMPDAWSSIDDVLDRIKQYFAAIPDNIDEDFVQDANKLLTSIVRMARKPRVALVGRSDVGKSTLINSLIGNKTLPEEWTPTTSIIIYVKHISDKPEYISDNVIILKSGENQELWDDTKISDKDYTLSLSIASGDYNILNEYGSRQGSKYSNTDATSAVVFVESDILNNCDLLDLPGYGTKDREADDALLSKVRNVDVLIYMSLSNGFMRGDDITWLQSELPNLAPITLNNKLSPLANLFIVASQAHVVSNGSSEVLSDILSKGADRFETTITTDYWAMLGQNVNSNSFRKRFFTYSTDQRSLRESFEKDLRDLLTAIPSIIRSNLLAFLKAQAQSNYNKLDYRMCSFREILIERSVLKEKIAEIERNEPKRIAENESKKKDIQETISSFKQRSVNDFSTKYNMSITVDNIVEIINSNNLKKKDEDLKLLSSKLSNIINEHYGNILKNFSEQFSVKVDSYIKGFENDTHIAGITSTSSKNEGFDFKASFAGGLAGVATYGALSIWVSSLGNLGAYILVAKGVSLLASIGISVGGVGAAASAIAAIGGPIVIMVGVAALIAIGIAWLFGSNWRKSIAKKIVQQYDKENVLETYIKNIKTFWDDTDIAFLASANAMESDYESYLNDLKKKVWEVDNDEINEQISKIELELNFYKKIIDNINE